MCPNKNDSTYKKVSAQLGETQAFALWNKYEGNVRKITAEANRLAEQTLQLRNDIPSQEFLDTNLQPTIKRLTKDGNSLKAILSHMPGELVQKLHEFVSPFVHVDFNAHSNLGTENGRYDNGNRKIDIYSKNLNAKYADPEEVLVRTIIHEAGHSLISARAHLFLQGKTEHLSDFDVSGLKVLHDIYSGIKEKAKDYYGFSSFPEFLNEVISNPKMVDTVNDIEKGLFRRIFDHIQSLLQNILGLDNKLSTKAQNIMLSLIGSYNEAQENQLQDYLQGVYDYSKSTAPITDLSEISARRNKADLGYDEDTAEALKYLNVLMTPGEQAYESRIVKIGNQEIDFTGLANTAEALMPKILKEIVEPARLAEKNTSTNLVNWFNEGGVISAFASHFSPKTKNEAYIKSVAVDIAGKHLAFNPATDYAIRYDSNEAKSLGLYKEGFIGNNPVIVLHGYKGGKTNLISVVDLTHKDIKEQSRDSLFSFIDPSIKTNKAKTTPFFNTELGYRQFALTAQVMAMKEANPDLQIRRAFVGQLDAPVFKTSYLEMNNQLREIKELIKNKDVLNSLGPIGKVISNEKLLNPAIYHFSYFHFLLNHYVGATEMVNKEIPFDGVTTWSGYGDGDGQVSKASLNIMSANVRKMVEDPKNVDWLEILNARARVISERHSTITDQGLQGEYLEELKLLEGAVKQLKAHRFAGNGFILDSMNVFDTHLTSPQNWSNPILQFAKRSVEAGYFRMNEEFVKWNEGMKDAYKRFDEYLHTSKPGLFGKEWVSDVSEERFSGVFKKRNLTTVSGTNVRRYVHELHIDLNDPETKEAIAAGETSKAEVEFGKAVNDSMKNQMRINLEEAHLRKKMNDYHGILAPGTIDKYKLEAKEVADKAIRDTWKEGVVPVMTKTVFEYMFGKDFRKGFDKFMGEVTNPNEVFTDFKKDHVKSNQQMGQIMSSTNKTYGSDERMKSLGLVWGKDGKVYATDEETKDVSFDLELQLKYFMMMSMRANEFNKTVLPEVNAAKILLATYHEDPALSKHSLEALDMYVKTKVHGESQQLAITPEDTGKANLDKVMSFAMRAFPFAAFSWSIPTGLSAMVQNITTLTNVAFSHTVGSDNLFGLKESTQALQEIFHNSNKVEAIMKQLQLADVNPADLVHGTRKGYHTQFQKHVFTDHSMQVLNWAPDYVARMVISIGQMIKDGTYDAVIVKDGVIVGHDNSLDKRWQQPHGKELKEAFLQSLKDDGLISQEATEPDRAYDIQGSNAIRDLASQKVVGGYQGLEQNNLAYGILGRGFKSTRNWIFNKWTNLYQHGFERDTSGKDVFNEETGQVEFHNDYFEGKINSVMRLKDVIKDAYDGDVSFWTGVNALPNKSKQNIAQLSADITLAIMAYMIVRGLTDKDDEDDEINVLGKFSQTRFGKSMVYGIYDLTAEWNPLQILKTLQSPFAVLPYLYHTMDFGTSLMTFDMEAALAKSKNVAPLGSSVVGILDLKDLMEPSK